MTIEFKQPTASEWDFLGRFRATPEELEALRELLEGQSDPYVVLDLIGVPIVKDALSILKSDGYRAKVSFKEDN